MLVGAGGSSALALQGAYPVAGSSIIELPTQAKALAVATATATSALQQRCNGYANLREAGTLVNVKRVLLQAHPETGGFLVTVRLSASCIVSTATPNPGTFHPAPPVNAVPPVTHNHSNRPGTSASPNANTTNGNGANNGNGNGNGADNGNNANGGATNNRGGNGGNGNGNGNDANGDNPNGNGRE
jgi:hypothetical protein